MLSIEENSLSNILPYTLPSVLVKSESLSTVLTSEMEENDVKESLMASSLALTVF